MTEEEDEACKKLLNPQSMEASESNSSTLTDRLREKQKKRKAGQLEDDMNNKYRNVDYICGSAAEVERL